MYVHDDMVFYAYMYQKEWLIVDGYLYHHNKSF